MPQSCVRGKHFVHHQREFAQKLAAT
jgi:hypothetical protein